MNIKPITKNIDPKTAPKIRGSTTAMNPVDIKEIEITPNIAATAIPFTTGVLPAAIATPIKTRIANNARGFIKANDKPAISDNKNPATEMKIKNDNIKILFTIIDHLKIY